MKICRTQLEHYIKEEIEKIQLEEGWKDVAMAGAMGLGSILPGGEAAANIHTAPAAKVQQATAPLRAHADMREQALKLFLTLDGELNEIGQNELMALNQTNEDGTLTSKAQLERATLFANPEDAPEQLTATDLIDSLR